MTTQQKKESRLRIPLLLVGALLFGTVGVSGEARSEEVAREASVLGQPIQEQVLRQVYGQGIQATSLPIQFFSRSGVILWDEDSSTRGQGKPKNTANVQIRINIGKQP
ncbi:hypothetical protein [Marinobacterium jannaschii]|uniref:hypothetical protein n=1 Tax=Marinobacterium jannaschii TaxID=64970 RepID=UPI000481C8EB|nr:hypothetical protein [Marinobacterium jannaschii]